MRLVLPEIGCWIRLPPECAVYVQYILRLGAASGCALIHDWHSLHHVRQMYRTHWTRASDFAAITVGHHKPLSYVSCILFLFRHRTSRLHSLVTTLVIYLEYRTHPSFPPLCVPGLVMGTIMLDHKFLVCSSTIYARAWAKFSARAWSCPSLSGTHFPRRQLYTLVPRCLYGDIFLCARLDPRSFMRFIIKSECYRTIMQCKNILV